MKQQGVTRATAASVGVAWVWFDLGLATGDSQLWPWNVWLDRIEVQVEEDAVPLSEASEYTAVLAYTANGSVLASEEYTAPILISPSDATKGVVNLPACGIFPRTSNSVAGHLYLGLVCSWAQDAPCEPRALWSMETD